MSGDPKKRSRVPIGWAMIALLAVYVLSSGPLHYIAQDTETGMASDWWLTTYKPLNWTAHRFGPLDDAYWWYVGEVFGREIDVR
jgi:hypothetical protein